MNFNKPTSTPFTKENWTAIELADKMVTINVDGRGMKSGMLYFVKGNDDSKETKMELMKKDLKDKFRNSISSL